MNPPAGELLQLLGVVFLSLPSLAAVLLLQHLHPRLYGSTAPARQERAAYRRAAGTAWCVVTVLALTAYFPAPAVTGLLLLSFLAVFLTGDAVWLIRGRTSRATVRRLEKTL